MEVSLIGIGMGVEDNLTVEALNTIKEADVLIGASRMTRNFAEGKKEFNAYRAEDIKKIIEEQNEDCKIAVLMSGDVGFFSGAKKLLEIIGNEVRVIPGISSVVYLCAKLHTSWQDVKLLSLHGLDTNIVGYVKRYKKVFALLSGREQIINMLNKLVSYNMDSIKLHIGQRLSYEDENIISGTVSEILENKTDELDELAVVLFENDNPVDRRFGVIEDEEFIRGKVPMTKSEIRNLSIAKLNLSADSVLYDIGAGTGSVSIEASMKLLDGKVYAIERKKEAVELINKNKLKFAADNVEVIEGLAPSALEELEPPTHAFIGGSAGNMEQIIEAVWNKNSEAIIVVNAIALNTVSEVMNIIEEKKIKADITLMQISKNNEIGKYQMMMGLNPVYIFKLKNDYCKVMR